MVSQRRHESPELGAAARRFLRALAVRATEGDTEAIEQLAQLSRDIDLVLGQAVAGARQAVSYSWADIAELVGTSRQNAQQRWANATPPETFACQLGCPMLFPTEIGRETHHVAAHGAERCPRVTTPKPRRCAMPADHAGKRHVMAADDDELPDEENDELTKGSE